MIIVKVLFFASTREATGKISIELELESEITSSEVLQRLYDLFSSLKSCDFQLAINKKYISSDVVIKNGDEIACIPPISGG
jgi:molybdopterin converting factor subunit 1